MEIRVLDQSFISIDFIDKPLSILWVERYDGFGSFELVFNFNIDLKNLLQEDYYLIKSDSDVIMIIEDSYVKTNPETGNKLIVTGRSLVSILDRRIILRQIQIDTTLQDGILALLDAEVIDGLYPERNFPNFIFSASSDPLVTGYNLKAQFYSENLYDVIKNLCQESNLGFKLTLNENYEMVFSLYAGADRSYNQSANSFVIFSPEFDNLIKSEYYKTKRLYKNYALTSGDPTVAGSGLPIRAQSFVGSPTGLQRREMFINASDISKFEWDSSVEIADAVYQLQLKQRGDNELAKLSILHYFDGEIDIITNQFKYNINFFLGDIIQLVDFYGNSSAARIIEVTHSEDLSGIKTIPTLKTI